MSVNRGYEDDGQKEVDIIEPKRNHQNHQESEPPDEGTLLSGIQTYFSDEKVLIPQIEKVITTAI